MTNEREEYERSCQRGLKLIKRIGYAGVVGGLGLVAYGVARAFLNEDGELADFIIFGSSGTMLGAGMYAGSKYFGMLGRQIMGRNTRVINNQDEISDLLDSQNFIKETERRSEENDHN